MNIHIQSVKVWRKFVLPWLKYSNFARGLFLLVHPVYDVHIVKIGLKVFNLGDRKNKVN